LKYIYIFFNIYIYIGIGPPSEESSSFLFVLRHPEAAEAKTYWLCVGRDIKTIIITFQYAATA